MVDSKVLPKTLFPFIWHFLRDYKPVVIVYVFLAIAAGFGGHSTVCSLSESSMFYQA